MKGIAFLSKIEAMRINPENDKSLRFYFSRLISFYGKIDHTLQNNNVAMISINEPEDTVRLPYNWINLHVTSFHDIDDRIKDERFIPFDETMAENIISFIQECNVDYYLIHCHAGISRSAAVARFIATIKKFDDFDFRYTLYNKHVYKTLMKVYVGELY